MLEVAEVNRADRMENWLRQAQATQEDGWHRRDALEMLTLQSQIFGFNLRVETNYAPILEATRLALMRFTMGPPHTAERPMELRILVWDESDADTPAVRPEAERQFPTCRHDAHRDWAAIDLGVDGHCAIDLARRLAVVFLSRSLADQTEYVARFVVSTALLNILTRCRLVQWHAAALVKDDRTLLLAGTDNSGKSATAFTLLQSGYRMLGESVTYTRRQADRIEVMGFPVGHLRLRQDGVSLFPTWAPLGQPIAGDDERKWLFDLIRILPESVHRESLLTAHLSMLFVEVGKSDETEVRHLGLDEAMVRAIPICSFWEEPRRAQTTLREVERTLRRVRAYQVRVGRDAAGVVQAVDALLTS